MTEIDERNVRMQSSWKLSDMTSKILANFDKDWHKIVILK